MKFWYCMIGILIPTLAYGSAKSLLPAGMHMAATITLRLDVKGMYWRSNKVDPSSLALDIQLADDTRQTWLLKLCNPLQPPELSAEQPMIYHLAPSPVTITLADGSYCKAVAERSKIVIAGRLYKK